MPLLKHDSRLGKIFTTLYRRFGFRFMLVAGLSPGQQQARVGIRAKVRAGAQNFCALWSLAIVWRCGHAVVLFGESLVLAVEVGHGSIAAGCLEGLAFIAATRERRRRAVRLWAAAEALREVAGASREGAERPLYKAGLEAAHEQLEVGASTEAWKERLAMTFTEAVAEALDQRE